MEQKEITQAGPVLNEKGVILPGYSRRAVCTYRRADIRAPFYRIKEWDFYQASDGEKCIQFTYGHASYAGQVGVMLFDFQKGEMIADISRLLALPFGRLHLPESAETDSDVKYEKNGMLLRFKTEGDTRYLSFVTQEFEAELTLMRKNPNSIVVNIPFAGQPTSFYYNQKINCMSACGYAKYKGKTYYFGQDAFGLLDWGRGVWPFHNEWYWSNGTGLLGDKLFGFNLGMGFGDTSAATENCLFYAGGFSKLGRVHFLLDKTDYMRPWLLRDEEGRLDLTLKPSYDRTTRTKALWVNNCCHQMFGRFYGSAVWEDGTVLNIDGLPAFAEHAVNNW